MLSDWALRMMANESDAAPRSPDDDFWYTDPSGYALPAGLRVTAETALNVSVVMACVRVISQTIAQLPLMLYERVDDKNRRVARDHPLFALLHRQPNGWQTSFEFREQLQAHLCLRGNCYVEIVPGRRGFADQLIPLNPDCVTVERLPNRRLRYEVRDENTGETRRLLQDEILHIRGLSTRGFVGISPLQHARETIGISLAAERFNGAMFSNKARPGTILEAEGSLTEDQVNAIRKQWERFHAGPMNAHRTAVLTGGIKAHELGPTVADLEFISGRKFQIEEICRMFLVPPHMVGHLERATFSNIEHQGIQFVVNLIQAWCSRWEQALSRDLLLEPDRYFFEFNLKGLMRGDNKTRAAFYQSGIQSGWLTRNEARQAENLEPIDGLDEPLEPLNMSRASDRGDDAETDGGGDNQKE